MCSFFCVIQHLPSYLCRFLYSRCTLYISFITIHFFAARLYYTKNYIVHLPCRNETTGDYIFVSQDNSIFYILQLFFLNYLRDNMCLYILALISPYRKLNENLDTLIIYIALISFMLGEYREKYVCYNKHYTYISILCILILI